MISQKNTRPIPLKNRNAQLLTQDFSIILTTSKRKPSTIESEQGTEFYNSIFQNFLTGKKKQTSLFKILR